MKKISKIFPQGEAVLSLKKGDLFYVNAELGLPFNQDITLHNESGTMTTTGRVTEDKAQNPLLPLTFPSVTVSQAPDADPCF